MDQNWEGIDGRGFDWSAQWEALVETPVESEGPFYAECSQEFIIKVADKKLLHIKGDQTTSSSSIDMVKGIKYYILVKYLHHDGESYFTTYWSWADKEKDDISFVINSISTRPMYNACLLVKGWNSINQSEIFIDGVSKTESQEVKQGIVRDTDGTNTLVVWIEKQSSKPVSVKIIQTN